VAVAVTNPDGQQGTMAEAYTFFSDYEGDVAARANGGDGSVDVTDWVQIGRFAAGLDLVQTPLEYQKADCAPRATGGDGKIDVTDWVQAGRYAVGLDAPQSIGGPAGP
jgi:hypothetical protein